MPTITQTQKGGVIRWDSQDWLKGLVPSYSKSSSSTNDILFSGLQTNTGMDIFRNLGYLSPGFMPTDATNVSSIEVMPINGVIYGTNAYMISGGAYIYKMDASTTNGTVGFTSATSGALIVGMRYTIVTFVTGDDFANVGGTNITGNIFTATGTTPTTWTNGSTVVSSYPIGLSAGGGHSGHTTFVGQDIVLYNLNGVTKIFYSWNDSSEGDVGMYDFSTFAAASFDDDYMSTVPTSGAELSKSYPHPMFVGDDGILYIGNGNNLASLNGTAATAVFNPSALDIPSDYIITSISKTKNYLVIFAYKNSTSGDFVYNSKSTAFFWDGISPSYTFSYDLSGNTVNGGFIFKDTVGCFVQGQSPNLYSNKYSRMLIFNGTSFEPMVEFYENIPVGGGVEVTGNIITWNAQGVIYQWGSAFIGIDGVLNKVSKLSASSGASGMLKNFKLSNFHCSAGTKTDGGLQKLASGYFTTAEFSTPLAIVSFPENSKGRVTRVKVYWGEAASGGNLFTLSLLTDRCNTTTTIISNLTTVTSPNFVTTYILSTSNTPLPSFESIKLVGSYTSGASSTAVPPYLEAVEVYYENANINN